MPEKAINTRSATGCLLVLLPAALVMSALFVAWPFILGGTLLIAGGNIWQSYEWAKTAKSIDPVFRQLIAQNRGEISPIDLSVSANISGKVSQKYLAIRADEFGTGSRQHPDRGQVYYFVSVSTLGDIFDDSELEIPAIMPAVTPVVAFDQASVQPELVSAALIEPELIADRTAINTPNASVKLDAVRLDEVRLRDELPSDLDLQPVVASVATDTPIQQINLISLSPPAQPVNQTTTSPLSNLRQLFDEEEMAPATAAIGEVASQFAAATTPAAPAVDRPLTIIIQSELAKRLDVHPSTIYKRRSEPDFTDWTRNRDPDGFAWGYAEISKEYYRLDA